MQPRPAGPQLPSIRALQLLPGPEAAPSTSASAQGHANAPTQPPPSYAWSDGDEHDDHEPPKKKRRRQALNCTECKRRKIRCDRTQPCAPCVKRGDQLKCQWHVLEPAILTSSSFSSRTEKHLPCGEYDALRARIEALEIWICYLPSQILACMPPPPWSPLLSPVTSSAFSTSTVPPVHQEPQQWPPPPRPMQQFFGGGGAAQYAHVQPMLPPQTQVIHGQTWMPTQAMPAFHRFSPTLQQGRRASFPLSHSQSIPSSSVPHRELRGSYHRHVPNQALDPHAPEEGQAPRAPPPPQRGTTQTHTHTQPQPQPSPPLSPLSSTGCASLLSFSVVLLVRYPQWYAVPAAAHACTARQRRCGTTRAHHGSRRRHRSQQRQPQTRARDRGQHGDCSTGICTRRCSIPRRRASGNARTTRELG
ncbi:hypothetical protein DFH06DRAFT_69914 [Mycena polygramma]|nr:hypothetical protein DFH06DRAFT_69914 [Mycena polygramma]